MGKKSVSRFSNLEYILGVAEKTLDKNFLSIDDVLEAIIEVRKEIELMRQRHVYPRVLLDKAEDEKYWREKYYKHRAIELFNLLKKWILVEKDGRIRENLKTIGEAYVKYKESKDNKMLVLSKNLLLNAILKSEREKPFAPSRFLIGIRNSFISELNVEVKVDGGEKEKKIIKINEEGIIYSNVNFMNLNPVSLTVLRDWGKFFELTNWFHVRFKDLKVISPKYGMYLTRYMASINEIETVMQYLRDKNADSLNGILTHLSKLTGHHYTNYMVESIVKVGEKLNIFSIKNNRVHLQQYEINTLQLLEKSLSSGCLVLLNDRKVAFNKEDLSSTDVNEKATFVLVEPELSIDGFFERLKETFRSLIWDATQRFVYIPVLKEETCKNLRISDRIFEQFLLKCLEAYFNKIELVRAPQRFGLLREWKAKYVQPIFINNIPYYLIRIKEVKL